MRVALTGSAGLVGSEMMGRLTDVEVVPIDVATNPTQDLRSPDVWRNVGKVDGIVHLGAISRVAWGEKVPGLCRSINVDGTAQVLNAARACGAWLIFASSREVYGNPQRLPVKETDPLRPVNYYGASKRDGEVLIDQARVAGVRCAVLRLSSVYGNRKDHPDRVIPALISRALQGRDLLLTGADHVFDFVHVRDVVDGLFAALTLLESGAAAVPTVHLATGEATSLRVLARMAITVVGGSSTIQEMGSRPFDVSGFCGSPELAQQVLGWRASTPLREGLEHVAADLRSHGPLDSVAIPRLVQ